MQSLITLREELLNGRVLDPEDDAIYKMFGDLLDSFGIDFPDEEAYALIDIIPMVPYIMESLADMTFDMPLLSPSWPFGDILLLNDSPSEDLEFLKWRSLDHGGHITKSKAFANLDGPVGKSILEHYEKIDFALLTAPEWKFVLFLLGSYDSPSEAITHIAQQKTNTDTKLIDLSPAQQKGLEALDIKDQNP